MAKPGMERKEPKCSTGWCVGPSSPTPAIKRSTTTFRSKFQKPSTWRLEKSYVVRLGEMATYIHIWHIPLQNLSCFVHTNTLYTLHGMNPDWREWMIPFLQEAWKCQNRQETHFFLFQEGLIFQMNKQTTLLLPVMFQFPIPWKKKHPKQNYSNPVNPIAYGVMGEYKDTRRLHDGRQPNGRPHVITKDLRGQRRNGHSLGWRGFL